ncbi:transposase, orfA [gamma proteobacterium HdN1]|nr:transposase, orfA [gamma proteobacterium HdN1]
MILARFSWAPRGMMGLILHGIMQGVHSLRALERLARLDLGCVWVCGGITPDHANIIRLLARNLSGSERVPPCNSQQRLEKKDAGGGILMNTIPQPETLLRHPLQGGEG